MSTENLTIKGHLLLNDNVMSKLRQSKREGTILSFLNSASSILKLLEYKTSKSVNECIKDDAKINDNATGGAMHLS